ncbi:hypothetical protein A20C1_08909 [marine actinobacterium PHSC20C1]|nr:hypothetical protein A20C1_08909 [marine actinobacterium PHSC20C1]
MVDVSGLPNRESLVFRNATVLTMDPQLGDLFDTDVWVKDGVIQAIGTKLDAPGARDVPSKNSILMPGLIDTHFHLWNSVFRGLITNAEPERGYFPVKRRMAPLFTPQDSYAAARFALAESLMAGMTTVVNWNHNLRSPADADANVRAQLDSGLRTRLAYGNPDALDKTQPMDMDDVLRARDQYAGADNRLDFGVALRGPTRTERSLMFREWEFARANNLPITMHMGGKRIDVGRYADLMEMYRDGLLGSDVQLVHAVDANDEEIAMFAETGTKISLSTMTEIDHMGIPPIGKLLDAGVITSLSMDTLAMPTNADMFAQMRGTLRIEHYRDENTKVDERAVLRMATVDGARDLGIHDQTGSLTVGKRADITSVSSRTLALTPAVDPLRTVVNCATAADIDRVVVDGRLLVDGGKPTFFDVGDIVDEARNTLSGLLNRAEWDILDTVGQA